MTPDVETRTESNSDDLLLTRHLDAPRDLVFKAWSKPEHLAQWWGPVGFRIAVNKLEFHPGGDFHYAMLAPDDGPSTWGRFVYRDILEPERMVFINSFSDETGGITRAPFDGTWPLEMVNAVSLHEVDGKTILTLRVGPGNATDEERATFRAGHDSMREGYGGTFDQLAEYVAKI